MKNVWTILLVFASCSSFAQWPGFNQAHPVSCQWPAYNYLAHGFFENVFVVDISPNFYDGYLAFGRGNICHPDSVVYYSRNYSAKCNENGDLIWWNRYDNPELDLGEDWFGWSPARGGMIKSRSGNIMSMYSTKQDIGDSYAIRNYLVEIDLFGNITEQYMVDSSFARYSFRGLIEDLSDSTYVTYGWHMDSLDVLNNTEPDAFLLKVDSLGQHIWLKEYPNTFVTFEVVKAMDGGYWVCANTPSLGDCADGFFQNWDFVLIKTDEFGNEEDRFVLGGSCGQEEATVFEYEQDRVVLVGRITNEENSPNGMFAGHYYSTLIEQQSNGTLIETTESKNYLSAYNGHFVDLHVIPNQGFLIVCDNQLSPAQGSGSDWRWMGGLLMLDWERDSLWFRKFSYYNNFPSSSTQFPARHYLLDSKSTPDGGWVCCGYIEQQGSDPNPYLQTPWLFKTDSLGCIEPGCQFVHVEEITIGLEQSMSVFPNPANDRAIVRFDLPADFSIPDHSQWVMIDLQGREIMREDLSRSAIQSGDIPLDLSSIAPGIYQIHWIMDSVWLDSVKVVVE